MSKRSPPRLDVYPSEKLRLALDRWRIEQPGGPSRAEAARRLMERGLDADAELARLRALLAAAGVDADEHKGGTDAE